MSLTQKTQVAAKIEAEEGVAETLAAADLVEAFLAPNPVGQMRYGKIERPVASGSLTKQPPLGGAQAASFPSLAFELAGPADGVATTEPGWSKMLRACGMRRIAAKKHAMNANFSVGTKLEHNWIFVADVTGASGRILGSWYEGEDLFFIYEPVAGTSVIGATDTAISVTINAVIVATVALTSPGTITNAQVWEPHDRRVSGITIGAPTNPPFNVADEILGGTSGARGRVTVGLGIGGQLKYELADGSAPFQSGETISEVGGTTTAVASSAQTQVELPSLTIASLHDVVRLKGKGCRGSWSLVVRPEQQPLLVLEFQGAAMDAEDAALFTWPGLSTVIGPTTKGSVVTIDGTHVPVFDSVEFKGNNQVFVRPNQADTTGLKSALITDRNHQTVLGKELVREAIWPSFARAKSKAAVRMKWKAGSATANTFEVRQHSLHVDTADLADLSGVWNQNLTMDARAGDNGAGNGETVLIMY